MDDNKMPQHWDEDVSQSFIDYERYFVPARDTQMRIMVELLRHLPVPCTVLELCCGEGLLAEMLLSSLPGLVYIGMDGSPLMLEHARRRLSRFRAQSRLVAFELADRSWRSLKQPVHGVLSSLAIHHLEGDAKCQLFQDVFTMLADGGAFIVSDMIEPSTHPGRMVAADAWDEVVRQRSIELDGTTAGLKFFLREGWNTYRSTDVDDMDHPSRLFDQLNWLRQAGFVDIDVHFFQAGHALFSGWKKAVG